MTYVAFKSPLLFNRQFPPDISITAAKQYVQDYKYMAQPVLIINLDKDPPVCASDLFM